MTAGSSGPFNRPGRGLALATASYGMFSLQDATVKWLVQDFSIFQILFMRSSVVLLAAMAVGRGTAFQQMRASRNKVGLGLRAALILLAWFLFFSASRHLGLAELTTIYFAAPVITVVLSVTVLKETVSPSRWGAVLLGFIGVAVAARPGGGVPLGPALLTLGAAGVWAFSGVLARLISRTEGTLSQMIISNALFVLPCGLALPWLWRMPSMGEFGLMLALGLAGGLGQVFMYEGYRWAPASLVAPTEYSAFVWAFLLGFMVWGDIPARSVWIGAGLIMGAGAVVLWSERRHLRPQPRPAAEALM